MKGKDNMELLHKNMSNRKLASEITLEYPWIKPSKDYCQWSGILVVQGHGFRIRIYAPHFPQMKKVIVNVPSEISKFITSEIKSRMKKNSLKELLNEVIEIIKVNILNKINVKSNTKKFDSKRIIHELSEIIEEVDIEFIYKDPYKFSIKYVDSNESTHKIGISIPEYVNQNFKIFDIDLPEAAVSELNGVTNLKEIYAKFISVVESLQDFWLSMKAIDENTWVIEPEKPAKRDTYRRVYIDVNLSLLVTINPLNPRDLPHIKFLGSTSSVEMMRKRFQENIQRGLWDVNQSIVRNLLSILDFESFTLKKTPSSEQYENTNCNICLGYQDNFEDIDETPQKWCNNPLCNSLYHHYCLAQWFMKLTNAKQYFTFLMAPCPSCDTKITLPPRKNLMNDEV